MTCRRPLLRSQWVACLSLRWLQMAVVVALRPCWQQVRGGVPLAEGALGRVLAVVCPRYVGLASRMRRVHLLSMWISVVTCAMLLGRWVPGWVLTFLGLRFRRAVVECRRPLRRSFPVRQAAWCLLVPSCAQQRLQARSVLPLAL